MPPEPQNDKQKEIAQQVDNLATQFADGMGVWNPREINQKLLNAIPLLLDLRDQEFYFAYSLWRSKNELNSK